MKGTGAFIRNAKSLANSEKFLDLTGVKSAFETSIGGQEVYSRKFDTVASAAIRKNDAGNSFVLQNNMGVLVDSPDIIDGKEIIVDGGFTVNTQSRATGHQSKVECGFTPQKLNYSGRKLTVDTELIDASVEICPANLIGSEFQDRLMGGASINDILNGAPAGLTDRIFNAQTRFKILTMDENILLGDTGSVSRIQVGSGRKATIQHHIDGIPKQIYNAAKGQYYPAKQWDLSAHAANGVTVWHGGRYLFVSDASLTTVINFIDKLKDVYSAKKLFTSHSPATGKVKVVSHEPTVDVDVVIYAGNVKTQVGNTPIDFTRVESPMPFEEAPKQMAYERVTKENAVDFFVELFRTVSIELGVTIQENPELSFYLAHDPLWSIDMAAALAIVASDNNQNGLMSQIQQLIRLIPVPRYMNTGMFFGTYTSNVAILTNSSRADLGNVMVYVDPLTGKVYYKNQMLLNAKVIDFNQTISNIVGYAEANEVTFNAPYEPYKPNGKSPDVRYRPTTTDETSNKARASVAVETTGEGSAAVEGVTFTAQDVLKKDVTVTGYAWKLYTTDGSVASSTTGPSATVSLAAGKKLMLVEYTATYSDGTTDMVQVPMSAFEYSTGN